MPQRLHFYPPGSLSRLAYGPSTPISANPTLQRLNCCLRLVTGAVLELVARARHTAGVIDKPIAACLTVKGIDSAIVVDRRGVQVIPSVQPAPAAAIGAVRHTCGVVVARR